LKSFKGFLSEEKVGKEIGGSVYLHKDYADNHPRIPKEELDKAKNTLSKKHSDHKYNIVRYGYTGADKGSFSFIHSPDFDKSHEPISGNSVRVNPSGETKVSKQKADPQIYHHKHEFVGKDYKGFDVEKSKKRSQTYNPIINKLKEKDPKIRSRMGTSSVWNKEVLPYIEPHLKASS
jgi:hypothetical protein